MAKIYKISGYLIDKDNYYMNKDDLEECFCEVTNYTFPFDRDLYFRRMAIEEANISSEVIMDKFDDIGVDLAELEKYFPFESSVPLYDRKEGED